MKEQWELLERFSFGVTEEDMSDYWSLFSIPQELSVLVCNREVSLGHERNNFIKQLEDQKIQFQQDLLNLESDIDALKVFYDIEKSEEVKLK